MVLSMTLNQHGKWVMSEGGKRCFATIERIKNDSSEDSERFSMLVGEFMVVSEQLDWYIENTRLWKEKWERSQRVLVQSKDEQGELAKRTDELNYYRKRYGNALNAIAEIAELTHSIAIDKDVMEE